MGTTTALRLARYVFTGLMCAVSLGAISSRAAAQSPPVMLALGGDFTTPVTSPAVDRYYPGGALSAAALFEAYPFLLPSFRLRGGIYGDGPAPQDTTLADPGIGSLFTLTAGVRLRPEGFGQPTSQPRATGGWIEVNAGAALTGSAARPAFDVGVGWAFAFGTFGGLGQLDLGPAVRFTHVLQTEETGLDASSAYVLSLGIEAILFDAAEAPEVTEAHTQARERAEREEMDSDDDGINDADDACPYVAEDLDGFEDGDGCPDTDDDHDGILDADDACPREAEDMDGFADADGCPDPDNDDDGLLDGLDACPDQPETVNGVEDGDGCPDEGLIELIDDRIVLEERVLFDLNRARVRHAAHPILQAVATLIHQHPEWAQLRIEGHADEQGEEAWNVELSQRRAAQVRAYLVTLGVPASLLVSEGYGSSRPRMAGESAEAYQANRRVEVIVSERTGDAATRASAGASP